MSSRTTSRRGNYSIMFGLACLGMIGFGAFAVDLSLVRLAQSQAQSIADAATQAGLYVLKTTGSSTKARAAALQVVNANKVLGDTPVASVIDFGTWDDGKYVSSSARQNAVRVRVRDTVQMPLASVLGVPTVQIEETATSAARALHVVLVMDITNSWSQSDFANARAAALSFLDIIAPTAGPDDRVGMVVFTGRYGVEHSPMVPLENAFSLGLHTNWAQLRTASKAGVRQANGDCKVYPFEKSRYPSVSGGAYPTNEFGLPSNNTNNSSWPQNYFKAPLALPIPNPPVLPRTSQYTNVEGGCYPNMWREYQDESGTDHTVGVEMAAVMFKEQVDQGAYRAMVILTDGSPNGTGTHTQRTSVTPEWTGDVPFVDPRWKPAGSIPAGTIGRYIMGPNRTTGSIQTQTVARTSQLYTQEGINTWAISFVDTASWMNSVDQGDGYFIRTNSSSALVDIFDDIAESLPVAIVE